MKRNRECGIEITSLEDVQTLIAHIHSGFGNSPAPKRWSLEDLEELRKPVETLRALLPKKQKQTPDAVQRVKLPTRQYDKLIESFSGWTQLTLEGISQIHSSVFTMEEVWAVCAPLAKTRFPKNKHAREKLRQRMQHLRDLGFVNFLERGRYERLIHTR